MLLKNWWIVLICWMGIVSISLAQEVETSLSSVSSDSTIGLSDKAQDPLEKFNRPIFNFNDGLDAAILKPVTTFYLKIVPKPLSRGIHNVFLNLENITNIANDAFQLRFHQMNHDFWRLFFNTIVGIGGLFDVSTSMGLAHRSNDFGLTLAYWGWQPSAYIVWPFFGPSSFRDGLGFTLDYLYFSIYPFVRTPQRWELYGLSVIDRRAQLLAYQDVLEEAAYDKYVFIRHIYLQKRAAQITELKNPTTESAVDNLPLPGL